MKKWVLGITILSSIVFVGCRDSDGLTRSEKRSMEKISELENSIKVNLEDKEYIKIKSSYYEDVRVELSKATDSGKSIKILEEVLDKNNNEATVKEDKVSNKDKWYELYVEAKDVSIKRIFQRENN
ncbi:hypothetical protein HMPREF1092_02545 [Clostridium thermobutyricum]|uniref:Lipoprotein n=1 Tax=Clostridium thermobutyricum TaxID=29372 RepID=N9XWT0_9CLOT|nr:hypothetical protein [Clostridium thermobutyricum]ENZ00379.1 hypothetical protein HMPREF1092_02545 [Clostridium thermobutyricum]